MAPSERTPFCDKVTLEYYNDEQILDDLDMYVPPTSSGFRLSAKVAPRGDRGRGAGSGVVWCEGFYLIPCFVTFKAKPEQAGPELSDRSESPVLESRRVWRRDGEGGSARPSSFLSFAHCSVSI